MIFGIWFVVWWMHNFLAFRPWDMWFITFIISAILSFFVEAEVIEKE